MYRREVARPEAGSLIKRTYRVHLPHYIPSLCFAKPVTGPRLRDPLAKHFFNPKGSTKDDTNRKDLPAVIIHSEIYEAGSRALWFYQGEGAHPLYLVAQILYIAGVLCFETKRFKVAREEVAFETRKLVITYGSN